MSIKTSSIYTSGNNVYFYSDRVKVFPCAYRNNKYDATARLNTEYNFTHLPHMVDKASYIIEFTKEKLICVIQGYYFEIELGTNDSGISDYSILYNNKNKYLNICVASPSITSTPGTNFIEGPHLCSWDKLSSIEGTLDIEQIGGTFFAGLKIGDGVLSNGAGYQCYALKLDDSAKLPIMANKIENIIKNNEGVENGTGKPINQEFTTDTLTANTSISTTSLNAKSLIVKNITGSTIFEAHSSGIIANIAVNVKSNLTSTSLDVINGSTQILKAWNEKVNIHKPTYIKGAGSNLIVDGTGTFGGKLTVSSGGADITGATDLRGTVGITGKTTIGTCGAVTEIENDTIKTSKITIEKASNTGSLVIDKTKNNIIEIKNSSDESIFSVDIESGETYAKKIKAPVEGISADAENVKTSINGKSITDIFETNGLVVQKASSITATSSTNSAGNIIIKGNTTGIVDALIPAKTEGRTYNIGSSNETFDNIYADNIYATTFHGSLDGNAKTATTATFAHGFSSVTTVKLTGNITGESNSSTKGWTIETTINDNAVTKTKIKNGEVTNDKLAGGITNNKLVYNSITIGSTEVGLGGSVGDHESRRIGTLYGTWLNLSGDMLVSSIGNIKVNNAGLKSSTTLQIVKSNNYDYVKISNGSSTINSLLVNGLSEFSGKATFKYGISVAEGAVEIGHNKLTLYTSDGNIVSDGTITAASFNAKSDRRLKENIIDYKPEKSILDLPIKKFDFIDGPKNQIGCIAQDLKEICPEIVNENEKGYLSIQESKLVYLLLDEVKKLKNEVEELKRK